jgi:predicted RNA methylase
LNICGHQTHEVADLYRLLEDDELAALVEDIKVHGLREPIWRVALDTGYGNGTKTWFILDGRNRIRACDQARVKPEFREYTGPTDMDSLLAFSRSLNEKRRHDSFEQRAMAAARAKPLYAKAAKERQGARTDLATPGNPRPEVPTEPRRARDDAGAHFGVSGKSVDAAEAVLKEAIPEVAKALDAGHLPLAGAAKIASRPVEEQRAIVEHLNRDKANGLTPSLKSALRAVDGPDLSQWMTDPDLARRLVAELGDIAGQSVLEPSAGSGNIVAALLDAGAIVTAYELDEHYVEKLRERFADAIAAGGLSVIAGDFLNASIPKAFDSTAMNPPFEDGLDGVFVETAMRVSPRIVVLGRLAMLEGQDRYDQVWSRCQPGGDWVPRKLRVFPKRPAFASGHAVGSRVDDGASKTAFAVVKLTRADVDAHEGALDLVWWKSDDVEAAA